MHRPLLSALLVLLLATALGPGAARAQGLAASLRAGTQGLDVGLGLPLGPSLNVRASVSALTLTDDGIDVLDDTEVRWDAEGDFLFVNALVDWHPSGGPFRITGGVVYNGSTLGGTFAPTENVVIGEDTYTPAEVGDVAVDVSFDASLSPYVGIGIGRATPRRLSILVDAGAIYQGPPTVDLDASGLLTPTEGEAAQIEENVSWVEWYPVVSVGLSLRLF